MNGFDIGFQILQAPVGRVVLVTCDSEYYERFADTLILSFDRFVRSFDCLHFHIISPSESLLQQVSQPSQLAVTYSYEDSSNVHRITKTSVDGRSLFATLHRDVQEMLVAERQRHRGMMRLMALRCFKCKLPASLLVSGEWLNANKERVYYACRRFMMPPNFFTRITNVLMVDVDSYFQRDVVIDEGDSPFEAFAIERRDSWSRFLAGYVYVKSTKSGGLSFLDRMRIDLTRAFVTGKIYWGLDQVCLDRCAELGLLSSFSNPNVRFDGSSDAAFVSLKGNAKWQT
jgi:hypothetical protein